EEGCGADVAGEQRVERLDFEVRRCAEPGEPGVVDQDVNLADSLDQALEVGWIAEVRADGARLAARCGNGVVSLGASGGVAAMDDDDAALAPRRHPRRERRDEEECGADVAGEQRVERLDFEVRRYAEPGEPGVVDQDVNLADSLDQALEVGWIAEVGADEARLAARGGKCVDSLGASGGG